MSEVSAPDVGSALVPVADVDVDVDVVTTPQERAVVAHNREAQQQVPSRSSMRRERLRALDVAALHRLPGSGDDDPYDRLVAAWLLTLTSAHTGRAYAGEARAFARWCEHAGLHPFAAERWHVDAYRHWLSSTPTRAGRLRAPASTSRALSALAGLFSHGVALGVLTHSPVADVRRPRVAAESQSIALSAAELRAVMRGAAEHSARAAALTSLLMLTGIRIGEALAADAADLGTDAGHRVLRITRKGGKRARVVLPAATVRALEAYLEGRSVGPLFCNAPARTPRPTSSNCAGATNDVDVAAQVGVAGANVPGVAQRWKYGPASRLLVQLFAGAGVSSEATAHSLRHSWVTESLDLGVPLQDVQDAAGHADPRTTRRYHRSRDHLDRSPNDRLAAALLG